MEWWQAVVLGIVQGLTEFLPISSSAHLLIVPQWLGWDDPGAAFTAVIQLGTMAAVLAYFRDDLASVARGWTSGLKDSTRRRTHEYVTGWAIVAGTVPICIAGFAFRHQIETTARSLTLAACALIVGGLLLELSDRFGSRDRDVKDVGVRDGWLVGAAQALALIPGVSRSGATISAARLLGFERKDAARFSFLLSVPAVVLSGLFEMRVLTQPGELPIVATVVATVVSFAVGYLSIAVLLRYLGTHSLTVFVVYRIALGIALLATAAV